MAWRSKVKGERVKSQLGMSKQRLQLSGQSLRQDVYRVTCAAGSLSGVILIV